MLTVSKPFITRVLDLLLLAGIVSASFISSDARVRPASLIAKSPLSLTTALPLEGDCEWKESELGWTGQWVRYDSDWKQGVHLYTASWTKDGQQDVYAVLTITITGSSVKIHRENKDLTTCAYTGTLSADRKSVSGNYSCSNNAGQSYSWSATIKGGCFELPQKPKRQPKSE